jgi:CheY-like chemotaxis protein
MLRLVPDGPEPSDAAPSAAPPSGAPVRVLVADDEETIRLALGRFLRKRGYEPAMVATGDAALAAIEAAPGRFAILLCDVRMPGVGGLDVAARARAADPDLSVVMLSGVHDAGTARAAFAPAPPTTCSSRSSWRRSSRRSPPRCAAARSTWRVAPPSGRSATRWRSTRPPSCARPATRTRRRWR